MTSNIDKSTLKCTHCNKIVHVKSCCFELVGYLEWWDHNLEQWKKDSKKASTATIVEIKIEDNFPKKASASVTTSNYGGKVLHISASVINNMWIIDSSATDLMTFDSRRIPSLRHSSQKFISIANGNTTPFIGKDP